MSEHELGVCSYFMLAVTLSCSSGSEIREELPLVSLECFYLFLLFVFGVGLGGWVVCVSTRSSPQKDSS